MAGLPMLVLPYQSEPGLVSFMIIAIIITHSREKTHTHSDTLREIGRGENHPVYPYVVDIFQYLFMM